MVSRRPRTLRKLSARPPAPDRRHRQRQPFQRRTRSRGMENQQINLTGASTPPTGSLSKPPGSSLPPRQNTTPSSRCSTPAPTIHNSRCITVAKHAQISPPTTDQPVICQHHEHGRTARATRHRPPANRAYRAARAAAGDSRSLWYPAPETATETASFARGNPGHAEVKTESGTTTYGTSTRLTPTNRGDGRHRLHIPAPRGPGQILQPQVDNYLQGLRRPLRGRNAVLCLTVADQRLRRTTSTTVPPVSLPPRPSQAERRPPRPRGHARARSTGSRKTYTRPVREPHSGSSAETGHPGSVSKTLSS